MKAVEFVKKFGIEYAIKILNYDQSISGDVCHLDFGETENLKQIVDAFELVETGLPELKQAMFSDSKDLDYVKNWVLTVSEKLLTEKGIKLKQAINLMEQCQ